MLSQNSTQPDPIHWMFTVPARGGVFRYGVQGKLYWKQYQPRGLILETLYPPRLTSGYLWRIARLRPDAMVIETA